MIELALVFPLVVVFALAAFLILRRRPLRSLPVAEEHLPSAASVANRLRVRSAIAFAASLLFALVFTAIALYGMRSFEAGSLIDPLQWFLLMPTMTAIVAVASFSFMVKFREPAGSRKAELERRTPMSFGPPAVFVAPILATVILVGVVLCFGLLADGDGNVVVNNELLLAGFPGFAYGMPVLIGVALLAGVAALALQRIASAPRPSDAALREADSAVRILSIRVIVKAVTAAITLTAGFLLVWAGQSALSAASGRMLTATGEPVFEDALLQTLGAWGAVGFWAGIALFVATIVFLVGAVSDASRKPFEVTAVSEAVA